ncbi:PadR family transcriptional regulator [Leifsonia sp. NPDC058292]|uniref:PadR family transcriptional regulator n=1 Tax=Leifsonia sp. NPDC058292 TaxID=3346428 RepID=UPI0036D9B30A
MPPTTSLTPLSIAALALLMERPMHPYEMYQLLVQRSEDRIVKVRPGSLYHTVDRLAAQGLVRAVGTEREGNRPERTTYEVTDHGSLLLGERVTEMLATPINEYPEFPLALGEAHNLPVETVIQLLRNRVSQLRADLAFMDQRIADLEAKQLPRKYWINVQYSRALREVETTWLESLIDDLVSGDLSWTEEKHH